MTRTQMIRPSIADVVIESYGSQYWLAHLSTIGMTKISRKAIQGAWAGRS